MKHDNMFTTSEAAEEYRRFKYEHFEKCEKSWFDRFYRFRERYYAEGHEITEYEVNHLEYIREKVEMFRGLKEANSPFA